MKADNRPVYAVDCETDPFEYGIVPHPFIWGVYTGTEYHEFIGSGCQHEGRWHPYRCTEADLDKLVDFLSEREAICYAHNGGKFDWHFISHRFEPDSDILIINGRIAKFTIGKCEFRDSFNLMPISLDQYNKMKFNYNRMHYLHREKYMDQIREYQKSDCVNLWQMVADFNQEYGLHITQAAAAMFYWNKKMGMKVYRSDSYFFDKFKPFYYGGRVQCFEQGDFPLKAKSADINSAYPHAMLANHAYGLNYVTEEGRPKIAFEHWGPLFFEVHCIAKGCFPYRALNGNLYYPDDGIARTYNVTGWELMAAIETKTIDEIQFIYYHKFTETLSFKEYIDHFWNLRKVYKLQGDKGRDYYAKIFLNSLYGKFATDPRKYKQYTIRPGNALDQVLKELQENTNFHRFREWLIVGEQTKSNKNLFYNVATAASVTGYVRAKLWRAICNSTRPLYCDTDSITAVKFGKDVQLGKELGQWEIENHYDRVVIAGKKLYAFHKTGDHAEAIQQYLKNNPGKTKLEAECAVEWKIASKGARLLHTDIIQAANGEPVTFRAMAPTFSASKEKPAFISRIITATAADIRTVPKRFDPLYND